MEKYTQMQIDRMEPRRRTKLLQSRARRADKRKKATPKVNPWRMGPCVDTHRAHAVFVKNMKRHRVT